jgi:hypothetical protein
LRILHEFWVPELHHYLHHICCIWTHNYICSQLHLMGINNSFFSKIFRTVDMVLLQSFSPLPQSGEHRGTLFREVNWCLLWFFTVAIRE